MNVDLNLARIVIDLIGWGLCGLTALWLLRTQAPALEPKRAMRQPSFNGAMHSEQHKQQVDEALAQVSGALERARQRLGQMAPCPATEPAAEMALASTQPGGDPYQAALLMAARGLPAAAIARRLDLPEAEIELMIQLRAAPAQAAGLAAEGRGAARAPRA